MNYSQENSNDLPEEVKNDNNLAEAVKNDNDLTEVKTNKDTKKDNDSTVKIGRNIHVEEPVERNITDAGGIADGGVLLDDEELPKENPINKNKVSYV